MEDLIIDKAQGADFEGVFRLLRQLWPDRELNEEQMRRCFVQGVLSEEQEYLVARREKAIIGFISLTLRNSLWEEGNIGYIGEFVIDEAFRNKGIGTKLLNGMIRVGKEKDCKRIELDCGYPRKNSHEFYRARGFEDRALLFSLKI